LRSVHLRERTLSPRACIVELLLCDKPGLHLGCLDETVVVRLQGRVVRLRTADFMLSRRDLFFVALVLCLAAALLCIDFRNLEHGERLAGMEPIADIDINVPHVAGYLGLHITHLIWLKLTGEA
jgi:hypothetical protein